METHHGTRDLTRQKGPHIPQDNQSNVEEWLSSNVKDAERMKNFFTGRPFSSMFAELGAGVHETCGLYFGLEQSKDLKEEQAIVPYIKLDRATSSQSHKNDDPDGFNDDTVTAIPPSSISSRANLYEQETLTSGSVTRIDGEIGLRYLGDIDTPNEADDTLEGLPEQETGDIIFASIQNPQVPTSIVEMMRRPVDAFSSTVTEEEYQNFRKQPEEFQKRSLQEFFECLAAIGPRLGKGRPTEKFCKKKWNEECDALVGRSNHCSGQASKNN